MNCAAAFDSVHAKGAVIADVNARNILVSDQAMVRLIDCDSFQIVSGTEQYLSAVGVPDYTPPELQGVPFAGVVRSANHDCFGLAVVIFHLLFMGRHPFFGAFTGRGDMPPDQAIKEFRFVYGADGFKKQMRAPPHSLPLHFVTPEVGNLFELAFSKQGSKGDRPKAARWMRALKDMTSTLKTCAVDETHKVPATASSCAWCEIASKGGPTFFYSANIPLTFECSPSELDETLAKLHQLEIRAAAPPPSPKIYGARSEARALPPEAVASKLPWPFTTALFAIAALFTATAAGSAISNDSSAAGAGVVAGLGASGMVLLWRAWFARYSLFGAERARRVIEAADAKSVLAEISRLREAAERALRGRLAGIKTRVTDIRQAYTTLKPAFDAELQQAERNAEGEQRRAFLDSIELRTATISNVGDTRKANLRAYGFESALDVLEKDTSIVPGIGEVTARALSSWAQSAEGKFRFDPKKGLPPALRQGLVTRFRSQKTSMLSSLQSALGDAERSVAEAEAEHRLLVARLEQAIARDSQARLDLAVTGEPSRHAVPITVGVALLVMIFVAVATRPQISVTQRKPTHSAPVTEAVSTRDEPRLPPAPAEPPKKLPPTKTAKKVPRPKPTRSAVDSSVSGTAARSGPNVAVVVDAGSESNKTEAGLSEESAASNLPETLNSEMISAGISQVGARIDDCYSENPAASEIRFRMRVLPDGTVTAMSILSSLSTSLAECVSDVLKATSFRPTQKGGTFVHSLTLPR